MKLRLSKLNKDELVQEISRNKNHGLFSNYNEAQLKTMERNQLENLILSEPNYQWDIMAVPDYQQYKRGQIYDNYLNLLRQQWAARVREFESYSREQLIQIMLYDYNKHFNPFDVFVGRNPRINSMSREDILNHFRKEPRYVVPGEPPSVFSNPDFWTPKPTQVEHIENLIKGLTHPLNDYRFALDGSAPGKGKTIAGSLVAKGIKVGNILVIAPLQVVKKWHDSLSKMFPPYDPLVTRVPNLPSGFVRFRVMNYEGLLGGKNQTAPTKKNPIPPTEKWARYREDMNNMKNISDNDWIQLRKDPNDPKAKFKPDWSFLPDDVPGGHGIGGTLVIFDEIHKVKNIKTADVASSFAYLVKYLSDLNVAASGGAPLDEKIYRGYRNPNKYVRVLGLSGSIIENMKDLTYIARALGIIDKMEKSALDNFKSKVLLPRFRELIPVEERRDWHNTISDADKKLLVYFRAIGRYKNNFSQIPDPVDYILYRLGILSRPYPEDRNEFLTRVFSSQFRDLMGDDYLPSMDELSTREKLNEFLLHLSRQPRFKDLHVENYVNPYKNMLTFQAIQIQPEDVASLAQVNRDITKIISNYEQTGKAGGVLGQIQRALSQLEAYKIVPFYELAIYALGLTLENGARPSVVIACIRVNTIRILSWSIEAYLELQDRVANGWTEQQWMQDRIKMINTIMSKQAEYAEEKQRRRARDPFTIKETFGFKSQADLESLPMVQLMAEYNKWVIYLSVNLFQHVCVLVGNFGVPGKKDEDYDPVEGDLMDNLKDPAPLSNEQKDRAKELFQSNQRKVILATMSIGSLGIDLMDTSVGGMNPRVMISSPGIIANVLLQMRKRIVREGQTSESYAMFAYVGDFGNVPSWEARLMQRVAMKVKNIQMLHDGEVSVDIKEGEAEEEADMKFFDVLKQIRNNEMNSTDESQRGMQMESISKVLRDALEGKGTEERLEDRYKKTTEYASQAKTIPGAPKPIISNANDNNAPLFKITAVFGINYFGLIIDNAVDKTKFDQISEGLKRTVVELMFKEGEIRSGNYFYPKMAFIRGFIGIMDRLRVLGMDGPEFVKVLQDRMPNDVRIDVIEEGSDENFVLVDASTMKRFDATLKVDAFTVAFGSESEIVVAPAYPILTKISADLLGNDLRTEPFKGGFYMGSKFSGQPHKMAAIYFAIIVAFNQFKGEIFGKFVPVDQNGIRRNLFIKNYFKVEDRADGSYWVAPKELFALTELIFFGSPMLRSAGMRSIFDFEAIDINEATGIYAIKIKESFIKILKDLSREFLG